MAGENGVMSARTSWAILRPARLAFHTPHGLTPRVSASGVSIKNECFEEEQR